MIIIGGDKSYWRGKRKREKSTKRKGRTTVICPSSSIPFDACYKAPKL